MKDILRIPDIRKSCGWFWAVKGDKYGQLI